MTPFLLLAAASLMFGLATAFLAGSVSGLTDNAPVLSRKVLHVGIFSGAVPAQLVMGFWGVCLYGAVMASMILLGTLPWGKRRLGGILFRPDSAAGPGREVLAPLAATALGGMLAVSLVGSFAIVGYLVCGWGDGAGEIVGRRWGRSKYRSPFGGGRSERSLEGSLAVLGVGAVAGAGALLLLGNGLLPALGVGMLSGAVGALAEGMSPGETDNFWVQVLPALAAWWVLG